MPRHNTLTSFSEFPRIPFSEHCYHDKVPVLAKFSVHALQLISNTAAPNFLDHQAMPLIFRLQT